MIFSLAPHTCYLQHAACIEGMTGCQHHLQTAPVVQTDGCHAVHRRFVVGLKEVRPARHKLRARGGVGRMFACRSH